MEFQFYLILGVAATLGTAYIISTRGIYYNTPDTDNELMAYAAAQSHKWRWLSDVHKYSASTRKVSMKECTVILLSIFQKIFRDKTTDRPYTVMTGLAVSVSTILIYFIISGYFSPSVGLTVAILYIISFWPWQVSLYGGHVNIANLFFLLSIYSIQMASGSILSPLILVAVGGVFLGLCLFSSSSSHKYFIAVFAVLFFSSYRSLLVSYDINATIDALPANHLLLTDGIIIAIFILAYVLLKLTYKSVVNKMYIQKGPNFLNRLMSGRENFTLEHYINHANKKIKKMMRWTFWILISFLLVINTLPLLILIAFITGLIFVFLLFELPNIKENVVEYFTCMLEPQRKTHFKDYIDYFAKRGITVQNNTRGAGLSWVPKMLWTFAPFHIGLFIVVFILGIYMSLRVGNISESILLIILALIAFSPIIWAEITRAPQIPRLYSPGLITGLLLPAYVVSDIVWTANTLFIFSGIGILIFAWNFWKFIDDIYPGRMTVRNFMRTVRQLDIKDIYTYQTSLNSFFVSAIPGIGKSVYLPKRNIDPPFNVHYIERLDEVRNGWIAIPGKNPMDLASINNNDFYSKDQTLSQLIETRQMDKLATVKFKTYITSTIWLNEDDITSYCVLHLKDIGPDDMYRGHAWLIHSNKLS